MAKWKELKRQVLAGTQVDSQGETNTKESLINLCESFNSKTRLPLNQQHDMSLDHAGYIDNFDVVPADDEGKDWHLIGDVHFHDMEIDEVLNGFSYSVTEDLEGEKENRMVGVYVPYPYYQDKEILQDLATTAPGIVSGAWRKKAADPGTVSLIISFALFAAAPAYTNFWNEKISPLVGKLLKKLSDRHSMQYVQTAEGPQGEIFGIYFIPERGNEQECLTLQLIMGGTQTVEAYVASDDLAAQKGVHMVRLIYSQEQHAYRMKSIEYQDGSVINI